MDILSFLRLSYTQSIGCLDTRTLACIRFEHDTYRTEDIEHVFPAVAAAQGSESPLFSPANQDEDAALRR